MLFVLVVDAFMVTALFIGGVVGGSLTMMAETLRGGLGYLLECFAIVLLRWIHRGVLADMEFGAGRLEQAAGVVIAASMLMGAIWFGLGVVFVGPRSHVLSANSSRSVITIARNPRVCGRGALDQEPTGIACSTRFSISHCGSPDRGSPS
jgi:hypothetical protein